MAPLSIDVKRLEYEAPPAHYVFADEARPISLSSEPAVSRQIGKEVKSVGSFRNPWPSWHKPTKAEVWRALAWGEDADPCIQMAARHITNSGGRADSAPTMKQRADQLLKLTAPDMSFDPGTRQAALTWLGHAGVLLQLRPLEEHGQPIRCLFDPIFSMRCSPTQQTGPIRTYPAPCKAEDLPPIDLYLVSHDHFDHCDLGTIQSVWQNNKESIQFVLPLGLGRYFLSCGVPPGRVTELDWWESVEVASPSSSSTPSRLKITCTPSQHNSGGISSGRNATLWSSWYIEQSSSSSSSSSSSPFRVYFAGDTGYQFHDSSKWPPSPPKQSKFGTSTAIAASSEKRRLAVDDEVNGSWPCCPAFEEIAQKLGSPDLLILPIAVGATFDYIRSWVPLPDYASPFPRHRSGVTAANHMPPWDAVRVLRVMTDGQGREKNAAEGNGSDASIPSSPASSSSSSSVPVAVGMHWGTFVPNPSEVLKTLGQLEWACDQHGVQFGRDLDEDNPQNLPRFLALNHGQTVSI